VFVAALQDGPPPDILESRAFQRLTQDRFAVDEPVRPVSHEQVDHEGLVGRQGLRHVGVHGPAQVAFLQIGLFGAAQVDEELKVRRRDSQHPAGLQDAMALRQHLQAVAERQVLDHVLAVHIIERAVGEGKAPAGIEVQHLSR